MQQKDIESALCIKEGNMTEIITYGVYCDGFLIKDIELPKMTQHQRDQIRWEISKSYSVPMHYLKLRRKTISYLKPPNLTS